MAQEREQPKPEPAAPPRSAPPGPTPPPDGEGPSDEVGLAGLLGAFGLRGRRFLDARCSWAQGSDLGPTAPFALTVERHRQGILRWFQTRISNGLLEGLSSLVQAAKACARGYRSTRNLMAIIYLMHGKLPLHQPT